MHIMHKRKSVPATFVHAQAAVGFPEMFGSPLSARMWQFLAVHTIDHPYENEVQVPELRRRTLLYVKAKFATRTPIVTTSNSPNSNFVNDSKLKSKL